MRIGLVGCVKGKSPVPAPAADLYTSTLFVGRRAYVERDCERWWILSALHGLVHPATPLAPYDVTLVGARRPVKREWAARVLGQLDATIAVRGVEVEVHAGAEYRDFGLVDGLVTRSATVIVPARGLTQGEQLAFYARARAGGSGV